MNGEADRQVLCGIAHDGFEVVSRLLSRDQLLAEDLRSPETGSRQIYREECITVELAATLRNRFRERVSITLFTSPEERRTGADWYWRFQRAEDAIHARVQAKRVHRTEFGQPDARGTIDIKTSQLEQLLEAAASAERKLPHLESWLATFARFSAVPPCGEDNLNNCSRHQHPDNCAGHEPSLWTAHASDILRIAKDRSTNDNVKLHVEDVVGESLRLDCLLPCIDATTGGTGPEMKGFTLQGGLPSYKDCVDVIEDDASLRSQFEGAMCVKL